MKREYAFQIRLVYQINHSFPIHKHLLGIVDTTSPIYSYMMAHQFQIALICIISEVILPEVCKEWLFYQHHRDQELIYELPFLPKAY